jgi:hypothetical protein
MASRGIHSGTGRNLRQAVIVKTPTNEKAWNQARQAGAPPHPNPARLMLKACPVWHRPGSSVKPWSEAPKARRATRSISTFSTLFNNCERGDAGARCSADAYNHGLRPGWSIPRNLKIDLQHSH